MKGGLGSCVKTTGWEGDITQALHDSLPTLCSPIVISLMTGCACCPPPTPSGRHCHQAVGIFLLLLGLYWWWWWAGASALLSVSAFLLRAVYILWPSELVGVVIISEISLRASL